MSELLDQCIRQLRDSAWARTVWPEQPAALATRLEWRRDNPANGDGFDLNLTSDETRDRIILGDWLDAAARAPAFLAPSWSRNFSEQAAWMIRNGLELTPRSAMTAQLAILDRHSGL